MTAPVIPPSPTREEFEARYAAALAANGDESIFDRDDPVGLFVDWLTDARGSEPNDANAMALATVDANGLPDCRIVLLKDVDARGFTFYSNTESAKGEQLAGQPVAALLFHWKSLRRQVRVRGPVAGSRDTGGRGGAGDGAIRGGGCAPSRALDRLATCTGKPGVLAGPTVPPA